MLTRLRLRDYLFVRQIDIEFAAGFGALTGETGAGKSLLVGALALLAGGRAAPNRVRPSAAAAEIAAEFSLAGDDPTREWLRENGMAGTAGASALSVRRVVAAGGGKSAAFVNGRQAPLTRLATATARLMDICGQHAHYSLRDENTQRQLLDAAAGGDVAAVAKAHHRWRKADADWRAADAAAAANAERRATLTAALAELDEADFSDDKWRRMNDDLTRSANAADIAEGCSQALALLDGDDDGAQAMLAKARRALTAVSRHDAALSSPLTTLSDAGDLLRDAARELAAHADGLTLEPERLRESERFVADCHRLARKHGLADAALLGERIAEMRAALARLPATTDVDESRARAAAAKDELRAACAALTAARQQAAETFAATANQLLRKLAMPKARLSVELTPLPAPTATGAEKVEFRIVTRPGMPPGTIADVASGGELSRLGLAIQIAAGRARTKPVVIFDEVDAGIGGATAGVVGGLLRDLGQTRQVLCVTHLPQVAACADAHWRVGGETLTTTRLDDAERVEEVARMNSSERVTDAARRHAAEMLAQARRRPTSE